MTPPFIVIDFETRSRVNIKKAGAWRYAEDSSTEVICLGYQIDDTPVKVWTPGQPYPFPDDAVFAAHNAMFEQAVWQKIMTPLHGWPEVPVARWRDTMASCGYRAVPLKLERAAKVLGLKNQKDMAGNRVLGQISSPNKQGVFNEDFARYEAVYDYCAQDVAAEKELWQRLGLLPEPEQKLWEFDQKINARGVQIDVGACKAALDIVGQVERKLLKEFKDIVGGGELKAPSQRDKVLSWCEMKGVPLPNLTADTVKHTLGRSDLPDDVRRVVEIRSILSLASVKKLNAMMACVCSDGRARGLLQYHGATTGRWSGRLIQPQNFTRGAYHADPDCLIAAIMQQDVEFLDIVYGDAMQAVSDCLRPLLIAGPNRDLACMDFSAIEAVVLACLAGETWKIDAFRRRVDIYCETASSMFGRVVTKDADPEGRQIGKVCELAFGYQGGVGAWRNFDPSDRSDEEIDRYKNAWRDKHPAITAFWRGLENAAVGAVMTGQPKSFRGLEYRVQDGSLVCRLPSGRLMWYNAPKIVWRPVPWDDEDERPALQYKAWRYGQWRTVDAYGGLLTENVVQAVARDLLVHAMYACEANGYPMILTVHDENLTEPLEGAGDLATLLEVATEPPAWAADWPINASGWIGKRYRKD